VAEEPGWAGPGFERTARGLVRRDARAQLASLGLDHATGADAYADGAVLRRIPQKSVVTLSLDGRMCFLKRYHYEPISVFLRASLKLNYPTFSGPAEWRALDALQGLGLRVPRVLAAGDGGGWRRRLSFILLERLEGRPLAPMPPELRGNATAQRALARSLAELVLKLHDSGLCHRDLYLANIFHDPQLGLGVLDCERVRRFRGPTPMRWRVKDLAALLYSCPDDIEPGIRSSFLDAYLGSQSGLELRRSWRLRVERKARTLARHGRKT
jgi:hypothetical protein